MLYLTVLSQLIAMPGHFFDLVAKSMPGPEWDLSLQHCKVLFPKCKKNMYLQVEVEIRYHWVSVCVYVCAFECVHERKPFILTDLVQAGCQPWIS